jgi:hypothetical protein
MAAEVEEKPVVPFYAGVRYENGTIISLPINALQTYSASTTLAIRAVANGETSASKTGQDTVVLVDHTGAIRGTKGNGRYIAAVAQAIRSAFFPNGKALMGATYSPPKRGEEQVPTTPPPPPADSVNKFYEESVAFPYFTVTDINLENKPA